MDAQQRLLLERSHEALAAAPAPPGGPQRTAVFVGIGTVDYVTMSAHLGVGMYVASGAVRGTRRCAAIMQCACLPTVRRFCARSAVVIPCVTFVVEHHVDIRHDAGGATSVAAGRVSYSFGLKGPCVSVDTACSSSLVGMHYGARDMTDNACDRALAAGINLTLNPGKTAAFTVTGKDLQCSLCGTERRG